MDILLWAVPFFFLTMFIEWRLTRDEDVKGYWLKDSAASLTLGVGNLAVIFTVKLVTLGIFLAVYELRVFEIPSSAWWAWEPTTPRVARPP